MGLQCYCLPCKACKCNRYYRALGWGPTSDSADHCVLQTTTLPTWVEEVLECRTATTRRSQGPTSSNIQLKWDVYCYNDQATYAGLLRPDADSMVLPRTFLEEQGAWSLVAPLTASYPVYLSSTMWWGQASSHDWLRKLA